MASHKKKKKLCFVIGPIGLEDTETRIHADWLLEEIIQPVMTQFPGYGEPKRADKDHTPGLIDAQLINDLLNADLVIADLSGLNPNAFYEIGIRHMAQKPIIHMQLAGEDIPFDVSLYRAIRFSRARPKDIRAARDALKSHIEAIHTDGYRVENPVTNARGIVKIDEYATPKEKLLTEQIDNLAQRVSLIEKVRRPSDIPLEASSDANDILSVVYDFRRLSAEKTRQFLSSLNNLAPNVKIIPQNNKKRFRLEGPSQELRAVERLITQRLT